MVETPRVMLIGKRIELISVAVQACQLIADETAAALGEDRGPAGEACALLLAAFGGGPSDPVAVRGHGTADRVSTLARRVESATGRRKPGETSRGDGEVSEESRKNGSSGGSGLSRHR